MEAGTVLYRVNRRKPTAYGRITKTEDLAPLFVMRLFYISEYEGREEHEKYKTE